MSGARVTIAALGGALALVAGAWAAGARINATPSMPMGVWRVGPAGTVRPGDVVTFCLPSGAAADQARRRGYVGPGDCPDGLEPLIKPVAATPGSAVTVAPGGLSVDGTALPSTAQQALDSAGRPLLAMAPGRYLVPPGFVWVASGHVPNSWDSRYFGPVPVGNMLGTARPLWVLP